MLGALAIALGLFLYCRRKGKNEDAFDETMCEYNTRSSSSPACFADPSRSLYRTNPADDPPVFSSHLLQSTLTVEDPSTTTTVWI